MVCGFVEEESLRDIHNFWMLVTPFKLTSFEILYIKVNMVVFVCLCGQKLGSAWKILPVTARSLWSWSVVDGKIG
jgi:hypothetical protein